MPSESSLISAIIIFWNEERFLEEAIASVFEQSLDHWELLLVDDGSTDSSTEIARRCAEEHPGRVRYLEHPGHENRGMSASRTLGVREATGSYIAYLDGDDAWLPKKLEEQLAIMEAQPDADMVAAPLIARVRWTPDHRDDDLDQLYGVGVNGKHPFSDTLVKAPRLLALFLKHEEFFPNGFLARRDALLRTGLYEESFRDSYSDSIVLVKLCLRSAVFISSKRWYLYRKHPESNTHQTLAEGRGNSDQRTYLAWVESYFNQEGVRDPALRRTLRAMLFRSRHPLLQRAEYEFQRRTYRISRLIHQAGQLLSRTARRPPP